MYRSSCALLSHSHYFLSALAAGLLLGSGICHGQGFQGGSFSGIGGIGGIGGGLSGGLGGGLSGGLGGGLSGGLGGGLSGGIGGGLSGGIGGGVGGTRPDRMFLTPIQIPSSGWMGMGGSGGISGGISGGLSGGIGGGLSGGLSGGFGGSQAGLSGGLGRGLESLVCRPLPRFGPSRNEMIAMGRTPFAFSNQTCLLPVISPARWDL